MNISENINIEDLILKDVSRINNAGNKRKRENALREYYSNPNYCKCCGKMILINEDQKLSEVKNKKFCDNTCATKYNNSMRINIKFGPTSTLNSCDDDYFIDVYKSCESYRQIALMIGYKRPNLKNIQMIKDRVFTLGLTPYDESKLAIETSTKGELIDQSQNWQSWRSKIQKHARNVYKNSDKPKKCIICAYDKTYEVAHVCSVSSYDNNTLISEINNIDNLVALCPNHHWEYDHGYLNIDDYFV